MESMSDSSLTKRTCVSEVEEARGTGVCGGDGVKGALGILGLKHSRG